MKIVLVTTEYVTEEDNFDGGLANYTHRTALSLKRFGHEPIIVVASRKRETILHDGIQVHRVPVIWYDAFLSRFVEYFCGLDWVFVSLSLNREVMKIAKERGVDVVQYTSLGATALFRPQGIPSLARLSSYQRLVNLAYDTVDTLTGRVRQWLERVALGKVDLIFGPSRMIGDEVRRDTGLEVEIVESPFVINPGEFQYGALYDIQRELAGREFLIFFGTLGLLKGVKAIADMIHELLERHPDLCFAFVGKDLGFQGRPILDYLRERGGSHSHRIVHRNRLRQSELYPIVREAKFVVLPSRIDNFPNTCIEAMALGKVVIGTWGTSFEELIDDGESGFLCDRDDPQGLLANIERVMGLDPEEMERIGENARKRILELSPERIVAKLEGLYRRVMAGAGNGIHGRR